MQYQERNNSKAYCPQCRESADSRHVHANHPLRDLVKQYMVARPQLIAAVTAASTAGTYCILYGHKIGATCKVKHLTGNGVWQSSSLWINVVKICWLPHSYRLY